MGTSMLFQMLHKLEAGAAQFTTKGPLIRVHRRVVSQVLAINKRLPTGGTHKVPLTHVPLDVYIEAAACCEPFAAHIARMLAQSLVQLLVNEQRGALLKRFSTQVAHVWSLARMYAPMVLHIALVGEVAATQVTRVLFNALVHECHVLLHECACAKLLPAQVTGVWPFASVDAVVLEEAALVVP